MNEYEDTATSDLGEFLATIGVFLLFLATGFVGATFLQLVGLA